MEKKEQILQLMYQNELAISQLYAIYAQKFPHLNDFWQKLVLDENEHAKWIGQLSKQLETKQVFLDENRFPPEALSTFHGHILELIHQAKTSQMELIQALSIAVDTERALIERKYFAIFATDTEEIKNTFQLLQSSTQQHLEYTENQWNLERQKLGIT